MLELGPFSKKERSLGEKENSFIHLVEKVAWSLIPVLSCDWSSNKTTS